MLTVISLSAIFYLLWLLPADKFKFGIILAYLAWLLHAYVCFHTLFDANGWIMSVANSVMPVSWLSVLVVFLFRIKRRWVILPLVIFVVLAFILYHLSSGELEEAKQFSWQLDLHITLSMLAYSILSVATLFAVSLWVNIKQIRSNSFDSHSGLGALIEQEKKLSHIIFLGWLVLTTSLLSGVLFIDDFINQHIGHKVVFSFLAWLIFGILIAGRLTKGWRGEKLISLTILGMSLLAMGYLGSKIVIEWIL